MSNLSKIQHVYSETSCELKVLIRKSEPAEVNIIESWDIFMGDYHFLIHLDEQLYIFRSIRRFDMKHLTNVCLQFNTNVNVLQVSLPCLPLSEEVNPKAQEVWNFKNITERCLLKVDNMAPTKPDLSPPLYNFSKKLRVGVIRFECDLDTISSQLAPVQATQQIRTINGDVEEKKNVCPDQYKIKFVKLHFPAGVENPIQNTINFKGFFVDREDDIPCESDVVQRLDEGDTMENICGLPSVYLATSYDKRSPSKKTISESVCSSVSVLSATLSFMDDSETKVRGNQKEIIKQIISREIIENKSSLVHVAEYIEETFHMPLSHIDYAYVQRNYIKYLSKLWLQEVTGTLQKLTDYQSIDIIRKLLGTLDQVKALNDVPDIFKHLESYTLLTEHYGLVQKQDELILMRRFKKECWDQTVSYSEAVETELHFIKKFVAFLSASREFRLLIANLKLREFCSGESSFDELLKGIIGLHGDTLDAGISDVRETAKSFPQQGMLFLIDKFRELMGDYIKPVEIHERKIDNRSVFEVKGKIIVISDILQGLEDKISGNSNIEEVRFVGANTIHIDKDLRNEIWHGKNIAILANVIHVHGEVTWDVSGIHDKHSFSTNAATGHDGNGAQGEDGHAGESGGNVSILAQMIHSAQKLIIISKGGNGSKGQDGGDGGDGKDGKSITKQQFDKRFPSVVKFVCSQEKRQELVNHTLSNIRNESSSVTESFRSSDGSFIKAETDSGNEIVFSYCSGSFLTMYQAYLLYRGSSGCPGREGGEYGLGGQGGYAGEIQIRSLENYREFNVVKIATPGQNGENGKGGLYGRHGKDGWDIGYLDYQMWPEAKYRGKDQNSKLILKYYDNDNRPSTRVWCAYKEKYAGIIATVTDLKNLVKYEKRTCFRQNNDRQHCAQATRKKAILQNNILNSYSHQLGAMEQDTLQDLASDLDFFKQSALQEINKNQQQQGKHSTALTVKHQATFIPQGGKKRHQYAKASAIYKVSTNGHGVLDTLRSKPQSFNSWFELRAIELTRSEIDELLTTFELVKKEDADSTTLHDIEKLLICKYRLATLQEISSEVVNQIHKPKHKVADYVQLTAESAARYLVEDPKKDNNICYSNLGTLHQYFYEDSQSQREKMATFCECELQDGENSEILKHSLKSFILDAGAADDAHPSFQKYHNDYRDFVKKHKRDLNTFFEAFKCELSKLRNAKLVDLCLKCPNNTSLQSEMEDIIQDDCFLKTLYDRCKHQLQLEYAWHKCFEDQDILKEFYKELREKGPLSKIFRELLANVFGINIRLYAEDADKKLYLQDNHNPSATNATYILFRSNTFVQMSVNDHLLKLENERILNDSLYAQVLADVNSFKQKQQFDEYLSKQTFLAATGINININSLQVDQSSYGDEQEDIRQILEYFSGEERLQLKARLEKITSQYVGHQRVLHIISQRFANEGRHVSFQELCFLINSIISSSVEENREQNIFRWIVSAHCQKSWIDELLLLQIENYFRKPLVSKSKLRKYLLLIQNVDVLLLLSVRVDQCRQVRCSITTQDFEDILYLLSSIPKESVGNLEELNLSEWSYVLKEKYWTCKLKDLTDWQITDLARASYYLLSMENTFGTDLVEKFTTILKECTEPLLPNMLTDFFSNFHNDEWNLSETILETLKNRDVREWKQHMNAECYSDVEKDRDAFQLIKIIKGNGNTSKRISDNLTKIEDTLRAMRKVSDNRFNRFTTGVGNFLGKLRNVSAKPVNFLSSGVVQLVGKTNTGANTSKSISADPPPNNEESLTNEWVQEFIDSSNDMEKLSVVDRAIQKHKGFQLRDTQMLTVHALLSNDRNTLAQVSTGEGKSIIIVALSILKALRGQNVDIVTSSTVLAKRDAEDYLDIYTVFGISVSHNCSEDIGERKAAYSGSQVVYGSLSNFQRDYLLDKFYGQNIFGDRNFKNVIVDEVDSMLLDKGNNMLYLSHELPGMDKLDSLYIYIWQWINRPATQPHQLSYVFDTQAIKEAVLYDLYGIVNLTDLGRMDPSLSEQQKNVIYERLVQAGILDAQGGTLLIGSTDDIQLHDALSPDFAHYTKRLSYIFKECLERERRIHVPNYLRRFIERHLEGWIESAKIAYFLKPGHDYVVDVDRTGKSADRNPVITILDRDTGTDLPNSQWNDALHQFLQLKHGCKLSLQNLKAVYISNVSYFKLYKILYGLTGTLGSQRERDLLQEIHGVDFVTIPTTKSKKFSEYEPILCTSQHEWVTCISNSVHEIIRTRSALVICETVNDVNILRKAMVSKGTKHVHTYTRDYEVFYIAQGNEPLKPGHVIIATNLAGRGTDIKISKQLREAGGLHVCLTYLPNNVRIEQQAFGRAARSGDKGSGQLIICNAKGSKCINSKIFALRHNRNIEELCRISDIKAHYETQITVEEKCFKAFKEQYERLQKGLDEKRVPDEVKVILLQSCLDKWTFWLDENGEYIKNSTDEHGKIRFQNIQNKFITYLKTLITDNDTKHWLDWVHGNPSQMVKLGKYLSQTAEKDNLAHAICLFDLVIKQESYFSEAAHYYKAFSLSKDTDWQRNGAVQQRLLEGFREHLRKASLLFDARIKTAINAAGVVGRIKKTNHESIIQIEAYEEQQTCFVNYYHNFSQSIDDILGHLVTSQSFVADDVNEELAEFLYEDLLKNNVLKRPTMRMNISENTLQTISSDYGVSVEALRNLLTKYNGNEFDKSMFQNVLKKHIQLPSRELFWKLLLQQEILYEDVKYIILDNKRLQAIDPSVFSFIIEKLDKHEMRQPAFGSNEEDIFLDADSITTHASNNVFIKDHFVEILGKDKYLALKKNGLLTVNRKAHLDPSKIESTTFPCFDSIAVKDFSIIGIAEEDAEKVLEELVHQQVIEKTNDFMDGEYRLKIQYDQIGQIELNFCPVYENGVKGLLRVRFAYRLALQRIVRQLCDKTYPVSIQLMAKAHHCLLSDLLQHRIIQHVTVDFEDADAKLSRLYSLPTTKDNLIRMLSQNAEIQGGEAAKLFDHLVEIGWIVPSNILPIIEDKIGIYKTIGNVCKALIGDYYTIIGSDKKKMSLHSSYKHMENTIKKILGRRLTLSKDDSLRHIGSILQESRSALKSLSVPDVKLKHISKLLNRTGDFGHVQELHVYALNGLDHLLHLEEMKWSRKMFLNTALMYVVGIAKVCIAAIMQLYATSVLGKFAPAFLTAGLNTIISATRHLVTGYCNWDDCKRTFIESGITASAGVCTAFLSRGARLSYFGHKIAGPNFEYGGINVAQMTGKQLIETAGWKRVGKEVLKHITVKTMEGVAYGVTSAGIAALMEKRIHVLCNGIASTILSDMERKFQEHTVSASLREAYTKMGSERSRQMVDKLTKDAFTERVCENRFSSIFHQIVVCVIQRVEEAATTMRKTNGRLESYTHAMDVATVWWKRTEHIVHILKATSIFLDNINVQINSELNEADYNAGSVGHKQDASADEDCESFVNEVVDRWNLELRAKVGRIIEQQIIMPVLEESSHRMVKWAGSKIRETIQNGIENEHVDYFEKRKRKYYEELQNAREQRDDNMSTTENHIRDTYHRDLLKLMMKTKSPKLFAALVRENTPMDMTCVSACAQIVHNITERQGQAHVTIVVEGEGGVRQSFSSAPDSAESIVVRLHLKDNHFKFCQSDTLQNIGEGNNCLYAALSEAIPELRHITPSDFRDMACQYIERDPDIQQHIRKGWHRLPIFVGAYGGATNRARSKIVYDPDLASVDTEGSPCPNEYTVRSTPDHIVDRLQRYIRFGGTAQRISNETNINRDEVVEGGPSKYQDRSSKRGKEGIEAAHVVRAGAINSDIRNNDRHRLQYMELRNYLGHTQNVCKEANDPRGIGGLIDRYQTCNLKQIMSIDFSSSLTAEDASTLQSLRDTYSCLLDADNETTVDKHNLMVAKHRITNMKLEELFEKGKEGYEGKYMRAYQ